MCGTDDFLTVDQGHPLLFPNAPPRVRILSTLKMGATMNLRHSTLGQRPPAWQGVERRSSLDDDLVRIPGQHFFVVEMRWT